MTDWFSAEQGVKQGDNLSPTLLSAYVNSLLGELKFSGVGIKLDGECISVWLMQMIWSCYLKMNKTYTQVYTHSGTSCPQCVYQIC